MDESAVGAINSSPEPERVGGQDVRSGAEENSTESTAKDETKQSPHVTVHGSVPSTTAAPSGKSAFVPQPQTEAREDAPDTEAKDEETPSTTPTPTPLHAPPHKNLEQQRSVSAPVLFSAGTAT